MMDERVKLFIELLNDPMVDSFSMSKVSRDMYPYRMQVRFKGDASLKYLNFMSMMGMDQCLGQYRDEREKRLTSSWNSNTTDEEFTNYMLNLGLKGNPK